MLPTILSRIKDFHLYPRLLRDYRFLKQLWRYLRLRISGVHAWKSAVAQPPSALGVNVTGICNARCVYCAYQFHKPDGVMEMSVFRKAVRDFIDLGGGELGFSPVTGDPLTDPLLMGRLEWVCGLDKITSLQFSTNGIALSKKGLVDDLLKFARRKKMLIEISMPGFDKTRFKRVYGVSGYESTLSGIHNLVKSNKESGSPCRIRFILQPDCGGILRDKDYLTMIAPYVEPSNVFVTDRIVNNWCGQISQNNLTGDMILMRNLPFRRIPCKTMLEGTIDVLVDGDVRVCGCVYGKKGKHDELVIGNIMKDSMKDIWFGKKFIEICEAFISGRQPCVCRRCAMYTPYGK